MTQDTHTKLLIANDDTEKDPDIHTDRFETFSSDLCCIIPERSCRQVSSA